MQFRSFFQCCLKVALMLVVCFRAEAQTVTGGVNGIVTDPSGAVIPNAHAVATNIDTGVTTGATTNNDGIYYIRFLQIGTYKVAVSAPGFGTVTYGPFTIETDQDAKIDSKLALENSLQNVSVSADIAPLLNTENAVLSSTFDTRAIDNLPMVGRNIDSVMMFMPGAVSTAANNFTSGAMDGGSYAAGASINSNRVSTNKYILDGMDVSETSADGTLYFGGGYVPSTDAVSQVQVISANAPAEYGNVLGGDVLYQTKSGTNHFHGSLFSFVQNQLLDANSWGNKQGSTIIPRNPFDRNVFGGTIGGPIFKDRLFFFGDYQGQRYHSGGSGSASVLTELMRTGDFTELLNPGIMCDQPGTQCTNANLIKLYDAATPGTPAIMGPKNGVLTQNVLPASLMTNPAMTYLLAHPALYPHANRAPTATNSPFAGNYVGPTSSSQQADQFDVKVDWKASQKDSMFARFSYENQLSRSLNVLPIAFAGAPSGPIRGAAVNWVHSINSAMVNEFRAGYTRIQYNGAALYDPTGVFGLNGDSILGIGANNPFNQKIAGFSALNFGGTTLGNADEGATNFTDNTFLYSENFTWLKDRHTFKMGVQFDRQQQNNFFAGNQGALGTFYFTGSGTAQYTTPGLDAEGFSTGYGAADLLTDRAGTQYVGDVTGPVGMRQWRDAYFFQDDWKATSNLTLNLGIRYEYNQPIYEVNNKMSTIDPNNPSVILIAGTAAAREAGYGRGLVDPFYGGVMPRIGFAYSLTSRLVVRGGYGAQSFMEGTGSNLRMTTNLPFQTTTELNGVAPGVGGTENPGSFFKLENGFGSANVATSNVFNIWDKHIKPAFVNIYSLTTEFQVSNTASLQLGYVGEGTQHLTVPTYANQLHNACILGGVVQNANTTAPSAACLGQAPAPFYSTPGIGYNGTIQDTASNGASAYDALQATFRQRLWRGLQYTVNYTWGHGMTNSTGFYPVYDVESAGNYAQNAYDLHSEWGPTGDDVRHSINWNMVYDLPFGRGRQFGGNVPLVVDEILGGWRIGMTGLGYTGFPATIVATDNAEVNNGAQYANHYRSMKIVHRSMAQWFGTDPSATPCITVGVDNGVCAYGQTAEGTFGTAHPDSERAPGYENYGASVIKDFTLWHEHQINFRVDADNLFNSAYWGDPNNSAGQPNFGQITYVRSNPRNLQVALKYHF